MSNALVEASFSEFWALKEYASRKMRSKREEEEEEKAAVYIDDEITKDLKKFMEWYERVFEEW